MTSRHSDEAEPSARPSSHDGENSRQVERVLSSPVFRSSQRCQALLRHVAERTLAGETQLLKERTLGIEVFGRPPDYDTALDPVVRGAAAETRKKLAQYYQDPAHQGELRIELHPGSYVPTFHQESNGNHQETNGKSAPPVAKPRWRVSRAVIAGAAVLAAAAVFLLVVRQPSDLDRFWGPMLGSPSGVLFCLGQSRVYNFRSDARQKEVEAMIQARAPQDLEWSRDVIPLNQLVPMWDRYIALGDASCLLRLASVFEKHGKSYRIRSEASTTFSDLREGPAILIGAFDNTWTLRLVGEMRYTFYKDFQGLEVVRDRDHPENTDWKLVNSWPYWNIPRDYAIVSRVFDRTTDRMVVVAAGITHFGTEGAGEFLSDPRHFGEVVSRLPRNWQTKNLQIVLEVPVVQGTSGHPRVLATHVW